MSSANPSSGRSTLRVPDVRTEHRAALRKLADVLDGDVLGDPVHRVLYATDASIYEVIPVGVARPRHGEDLEQIVRVCAEHDLPLTARTAGTSLAGQAVGPGLVVDCSRYMTNILELDQEARTVRVQPGVIRDDLNRYLAPYGLIFGPDTSTSNRCMIGGMIGNNSCGAHSIMFGQTRDNLVSLDVVLPDGSRHVVGELDRMAWDELSGAGGGLGLGLRKLQEIVGEHHDAIQTAFPKPAVRRRNTGYPLDDLADSWLGHNLGRNPNLARFFCGTEGTLALTAEATLRLVDAPQHEMVIAAHFETIEESLYATVEAVKHNPSAVELMDKRILDLSKLNPEQDRNRWFVEGDPGAILVVEMYGASDEELEARCSALIDEWRGQGLGYAYPLVRPPRTASVWELRKAGLGVLFGKPGDVKPVTLVEDTAVAVEDLPAYIREFARVMAEHQADCVYYAHASVGELHMRPELNLKLPADVERAKAIASDVADLVNQFNGSLSGEHGDGRLRGPYVEQALGSDVYRWLVDVKDAFDPGRIFNPGNIVESPPMDTDWRLHDDYRDRDIPTEFQYRSTLGFQRAVEMCNGTGVCRRKVGGTMCPSYMATEEERESTRGRANLFRVLIQQGPDELYGSEELRDALDLCLSCKGCKNDCPSSVDMAKFKAEFEQGWMDRNGANLGKKAFANVTEWSKWLQKVPGAAAVANWGQGLGVTKRVFSSMLGIHPDRELPAFASRSFHARLRKHRRTGDTPLLEADAVGTVCLVVDEFTDRYDVDIGVAAVRLLEAGGWRVEAPVLGPTGRTFFSKGFVREGRACIESNLRALAPFVDRVDAFVGVEPSGVLTLCDEALDLFDGELHELAQRIAAKVMLVEDFVADVADQGRWKASWTDREQRVLLHGHCHQKALVGVDGARRALALPPGYSVEVIPSGCCGMAGSFGYESDHYSTSMAIGELVLFPAVRAAGDAIVAAAGTSCRHQIHDGTGAVARHPVEILVDALA